MKTKIANLLGFCALLPLVLFATIGQAAPVEREIPVCKTTLAGTWMGGTTIQIFIPLKASDRYLEFQDVNALTPANKFRLIETYSVMEHLVNFLTAMDGVACAVDWKSVQSTAKRVVQARYNHVIGDEEVQYFRQIDANAEAQRSDY